MRLGKCEVSEHSPVYANALVMLYDATFFTIVNSFEKSVCNDDNDRTINTNYAVKMQFASDGLAFQDDFS